MNRLLIFAGCIWLTCSLGACSMAASQGEPLHPSEGAVEPEAVSMEKTAPPQEDEPEEGVSQASPDMKGPLSVSSSSETALPSLPENEPIGQAAVSEEDVQMKLQIQVGGHTFSADLEDNAAADALTEMLQQAPLVVQMEDYAGFEKVGSLGTSLPTSNAQTTTQAGDIVLYNGNQVVIFYGSNSWSYTRLGRITNLSDWEEALGSGAVTVTFSIEEQG